MGCAAQEYSWFQDWMEEAAEQQYLRLRLPVFLTACRMQRLNWIVREPDAVQPTQDRRADGLRYCVSVLDSFLMYSARALLSHPRIYRSSCTRLIRWFLIRKTKKITCFQMGRAGAG